METAIEYGLIYFRLLGSPLLVWNGEALTISRRQTRALLFCLAEATSPISRDRLAFLFWPDVSDKKARRNLTRLLSAVRQELPTPEIVLATRDEVFLDQDRVGIDCKRFFKMSQSGEMLVLEKAVGNYGGEFLAGFSLDNHPEFEQWLFSTRQQYERLYLTILNDLIKRKKAAGDYQVAIQYAQQYLVLDDLVEGIHRQLIELFMVSGERTAALRQYEQCVAILERELGVIPLPETRAVYDAALKETPVSEVKRPGGVKPSWTTLPSLELPLIGREEAWLQLEKAYRRFKSGGFVFIAGEPGIGKSRLLQEFATLQEQWVLTANSHVGTQNLPYQPLVLALRQALSQPELWSSIRPTWLAELSRILPEVQGTFTELPKPVQVEPAQAQARLYEAICQVFFSLASKAGSMLLCLDDLHGADEATLGWLNYISGRIEQANICLLATYRSQNVERLVSLRQSLRRAGFQVEINLSGLSVEAIADIVEQLPASNPLRLATKLHQSTTGNPFFALETLRALVENDQLASPPDVLPLPKTVREAIQGRLYRLTPVARQVFDAAAVLSPPLVFEILHPTTGRSVPEVMDALDELATRQMLLAVGDSFQFQHDLVRTVVYEDLSHWRRRQLHRRAAETLEQIYSQDIDQVAAQLAYHFDEARETTHAIQYYYLAAKAAGKQHANSEAIEFLRKAIVILPDPNPDWSQTIKLQEMLADNLVISGKHGEAERAYLEALKLLPQGEKIWRATLYRKVVATLTQQGRSAETDGFYREALESLGLEPGQTADNTWWQTWLSVQFSRFESLYYQARLEEMGELSKDIEPVLEEYGTIPHYLEHSKQMLMYLFRRERYRLSLQHVAYGRQGVNLAQVLGEKVQIAVHRFSLGFALLCAGEFESAIDELRQSLEIAEAVEFAMGKNLCLVYLTIASRLKGDIGAARTYLVRSRRLALEVGNLHYIGAVEANQAWIHYRDGNWDKTEVAVRTALSQWEGANYPFHWLALWPSLAISVSRDDLAPAIETVTAMLDPIQQRFPDNLANVLDGTINYWRDGEYEAARRMLVEAIALARKANYL